MKRPFSQNAVSTGPGAAPAQPAILAMLFRGLAGQRVPDSGRGCPASIAQRLRGLTGASRARPAHALLLFLALSASLPRPTPAEAANFFVKTTGAGTACTRSEPCDLETAILGAGDADTVYVAAGTYTGTGDNLVQITRSIRLYGGWNGTGAGPVVRDPSAHVTTLDGQNARRVVRISGAISPVLDGFTVRRGNATGLKTECGDAVAEGCGGGILVYQAGPTISNNRIEHNVATTAINWPSTYRGVGGGMHIVYGSSPRILGNTFSRNTACNAAGSWGKGGGLSLLFCSGSTLVENNQILDNTATAGNETGWGGGMAVNSSDVSVRDNLIRGNTGTPVGSSLGSGLYWWYVTSGSAVSGNTITGNSRGSAVLLGYFKGEFTANRVTDNASDLAVELLNQSGAGMTRVANNIVSGGENHTVHIDGDATYPVTASLTGNTLAGEGTSYGVQITESSTVTMLNNIVAGHTLSGVSILDPATVTLTQDHTLFWDNASDGERGVNPVDGDPVFANVVHFNYHIRPRSAARDAGAATALHVDIDGDPRPWGEAGDIGADEYVPSRPPEGAIQILLDE